jgi:hypothetical protein
MLRGTRERWGKTFLQLINRLLVKKPQARMKASFYTAR